MTLLSVYTLYQILLDISGHGDAAGHAESECVCGGSVGTVAGVVLLLQRRQRTSLVCSTNKERDRQ